MQETETLETMAVQVPKKSLARLEAMAAQTGRSLSDLMDEALTAYFNLVDWQIAAIQEAIDEADAGDKGVEHARVVEWVRSWGTDHELPPPQ